MIEIIVILIVIIFLAGLFFGIIMPPKEQKNEKQSEDDYMKPQLKSLTAEQIEDIHSRGKITPAEKVNEWERMDLCAPGDAIGSAAWRCRKFRHCCHDCLVDYANELDEYTSIFENMKIVNPEIHNGN